MDKNYKLCIICNTKDSKYKCPTCHCFYCSILCFKEHKTKCNKDIKNNNITNNEKQDNNSDVQPLNLDEDEDIILTEKQLSVLKTNKSIMTKLKNKKIFKILKEIDSTKYKKRTLEKKMETDPDFKDFTTEILTTLGFIKNNEFIDKETEEIK